VLPRDERIAVKPFFCSDPQVGSIPCYRELIPCLARIESLLWSN
jgi:hypothetical protein